MRELATLSLAIFALACGQKNTTIAPTSASEENAPIRTQLDENQNGSKTNSATIGSHASPPLSCDLATQLEQVFVDCEAIERPSNPGFARRIKRVFDCATPADGSCLQPQFYGSRGFVSRPRAPSDVFRTCMTTGIKSIRVDPGATAIAARHSCIQRQTPEGWTGQYLQRQAPIPEQACIVGHTSCWEE